MLSKGLIQIRSIRPEVFCKKGVLRNFAKFTGKHLRQSLFFNKVAGLRAESVLKNVQMHQGEIIKIFKNNWGRVIIK